MDCSFCGDKIPRGTESIFVTKRGKALYFCSSKCERNMLKLERKERDTKWTELYRQEKAIRTKYTSVPAAEKAPIESLIAKEAVKAAEPPKSEEAAVKEKKAEKKAAEKKTGKKTEKKTEKKAPAKKALKDSPQGTKK